MMEGIKEESVGHLFNLEVQIQENPIVEEGAPGAAPAGALPNATPAGANGGGAAGGAVNGGATPGGVVPGVPAPASSAAPATGGNPGVPAQAGPGSRSGRGGAHRGSTARGGDQAASTKRDGRASSSGAHAKRPGTARTVAAQPGDGGQNAPVPAGLAPRQPQRLQYSAPSVDGGNHVEHSEGPGVDDEFARVGRNDPCPCGSGRKFKRCHGDPRNRADL
jgi:preprotein translocase subunit SecA